MSIIKFRDGSTIRFREYSTITLRGTDGIDNPPVIYYDSNKTAYIDVYDILYETYYYIKEKIINALQIKVEDDIDGIITDKLGLYLNEQYRSDGRYLIGIWPSNKLRVTDSSNQTTETYIDIHVTKSKKPTLNVPSSIVLNYQDRADNIENVIRNQITISDYYFYPNEIDISIQDKSNSDGIYTEGNYSIKVEITDPSGNSTIEYITLNITIPSDYRFKWEYIGTSSGYYDKNYNFGILSSFDNECYTPDRLLSYLSPPENYCDGYIIRTQHAIQYYDPYGPITKFCPTYYYRVKYYRVVRKWKYIGTNSNVSSYNGTYFSHDGTTCKSDSYFESYLNSSSSYNPNNYALGYILRVRHTAERIIGDPDDPDYEEGYCTTYYFRVVEEEVDE